MVDFRNNHVKKSHSLNFNFDKKNFRQYIYLNISLPQFINLSIKKKKNINNFQFLILILNSLIFKHN